VIALEARLAAPQGAEDGLGHVVSAFFALAIVARQSEEGGSVLDLHAFDVGRLRHDVPAGLLLDFEPEGLELGNLSLETRSFVLAATPFAGALGSFTESSMVHEFPGRMGRAEM
jgi:hypothetical protein